MLTGVKIERQGDGSYDVLFDDGYRAYGCSFGKAIKLAESRLFPDSGEQEIVQETADVGVTFSGMDNGCSVWSKPCGDT